MALQLVLVAAPLPRLGTVSMATARGLAAVVSAVAVAVSAAAVLAATVATVAHRMAAAAVVPRPLLAAVRAEHSRNGSQTHFFAIWTEQAGAPALRQASETAHPARAAAVAVEIPAMHLKMAATAVVVAGSTT